MVLYPVIVNHPGVLIFNNTTHMSLSTPTDVTRPRLEKVWQGDTA
jgi:hypothetical protein